MEYLWVFIAGCVVTLTSAGAGFAAGWLAYERYVHKPRMAEIEEHREAIEKLRKDRV